MSKKGILRYLPIIGNYITHFAPGHYYSPIPSRDDILSRKDSIYAKKNILDINHNEDFQLKYLEEAKDNIDLFLDMFKNNSKDHRYR